MSMEKLHFTWNGTKSQAKAYVKSVKREQEKKRRAPLLAKYGAKLHIAWQEREAWEKQYFGEIV